MSGSALDRLRARRAAVGSPLCLGIDPQPDRLPEGLAPTAQGIEAFARGVIEAAAPFASAVKINAAFFEAFGSAGWAALERTRADVPADVPCILDAKRGDIETSAERYAEAILGHLDADGVTVSPYLGEDAVEPFRDAATGDRLVYVLARTSNPSAGRFQSLVADGDPIHLHVARWVAERWTDGRVGLVVGATAPQELATIREAVPGPAFLVPGVGAQGGDASAAARAADGSWAPGLVNVSRGIALASSGADWREAAAAAASAHAGRLADAVLHSEASPVRAGEIGGS
jgi:orotidine-5'-phosphate decarboxylase